MVKTTDPSKMTEDELNAELGIEPEVKKPEEGAPKPNVIPPKPDPKEEPEELEVIEEGEEEPPEPEEVKPPSRREQLRIQQILSKLKEQQVAPVTPPAPQGGIDYDKELDAAPELIKRLQADRQAGIDASFNQGLEATKTIQFNTRLEIDAPRIEAKYPQLDPNSEQFKPETRDAVISMYLAAVGWKAGDKEKGVPESVANPDIRYSHYVEAVFELANDIAGEKTETSRKRIVKQAAQTGLRPDGSKVKRLNLNKDPKSMSDEELDAAIALGVPKR